MLWLGIGISILTTATVALIAAIKFFSNEIDE